MTCKPKFFLFLHIDIRINQFKLMKLKQITKLLSAAFSAAIILGSCNENSVTYTDESASANAQIYSLSLAAIPVTKEDSTNFGVLANTRFAIDQFRAFIYNPDSLPYKTRLTKYLPTFTFANPSKIEVLYPKDSVVSWTTSDSIDFSLSPKIRVIPANGSMGDARTYTIDIRIHKVDPDSLVWTNMTASHILPSAVEEQKTLLVGSKFYAFSKDYNNSFKLYTLEKESSTPNWVEYNPSVIPNSVNLESITYFNNSFYALDENDKSYSSTDGVSWVLKSSDVHSILGVLPGKTTQQDSILLVVNNAGKYLFAKTVDMQNISIVNKISYDIESNEVPAGFPLKGFTSVTTYDKYNLNINNVLTVTAGVDSSNKGTNLTWSLRSGNDRLEVISNQINKVFSNTTGVSTFAYDGYIYALTNNVFYTTKSFGANWDKGSYKQVLYPEMPKASAQSIIVDNENYIWIFGGVFDSNNSIVRQVWKGRINRLAQ